MNRSESEFGPDTILGNTMCTFDAEKQALLLQHSWDYKLAYVVNAKVNNLIVSTEWRAIGMLDAFVEYVTPIMSRAPYSLSQSDQIITSIQTSAEVARMYLNAAKDSDERIALQYENAANW